MSHGLSAGALRSAVAGSLNSMSLAIRPAALTNPGASSAVGAHGKSQAASSAAATPGSTKSSQPATTAAGTAGAGSAAGASSSRSTALATIAADGTVHRSAAALAAAEAAELQVLIEQVLVSTNAVARAAVIKKDDGKLRAATHKFKVWESVD